jgi:hypothetical protein
VKKGAQQVPETKETSAEMKQTGDKSPSNGSALHRLPGKYTIEIDAGWHFQSVVSVADFTVRGPQEPTKAAAIGSGR